MCSEVIFFFFFYYTKILKTAAISPLHTGHSETALEQLAQRQRWPHGTTAYSGSPSQQMAHSAVAGSGSGSSTNSSPSAFSLPLDAAVLVMYGFAATLRSSQVRTAS